MLWWLSLRPERSSLWMTIALVLVLWSVPRLLTMWRVLHLGLIAAVPMLLLVLVAWAVLEIPAPPQSRTGVPPVPASASRSARRQRPRRLRRRRPARLPRPRRLVLLRARAEDAAPPAISNTVSILSATYTGTVQDKVAQFDAAIQIATTATNQIVPLFGEDVALESFAAKGEARLVREGRTVGVLLPARGSVTLQLKLIAKLGGDVTRRQLAFGIPPGPLQPGERGH